jgi:hypothetical protein
MSLINEALKRTRDSSFQSPVNRAAVATSYRIEGGTSHSHVSSRGGVGTTLVVAVIAITVGTVFATRLIKHARTISAGFGDAIETVAAPAPTPPAIADCVPSRRDSPPPAVPERQVQEDQLVDKVVEKLKAEQATAKPPAPEPPKLVLQGITSGGGAREAMINGINVHEGDDVDGARVVAIEPRRVKLQFGDRELLVRLP